jgi:hypothetical protein
MTATLTVVKFGTNPDSREKPKNDMGDNFNSSTNSLESSPGLAGFSAAPPRFRQCRQSGTRSEHLGMARENGRRTGLALLAQGRPTTNDTANNRQSTTNDQQPTANN